MHELSLCRHMIAMIEAEANVRGFSQVITVMIEIGALANVEKSAFEFGFEVLSKGTWLDQAALKFIDVPGEALCLSCQRVIPIMDWFDHCPYCDGDKLEIQSGKEFRIQSLIVE